MVFNFRSATEKTLNLLPRHTRSRFLVQNGCISQLVGPASNTSGTNVSRCLYFSDNIKTESRLLNTKRNEKACHTTPQSRYYFSNPMIGRQKLPFIKQQIRYKASSTKNVSQETDANCIDKPIIDAPQNSTGNTADLFGDHVLVHSSKSLWELLRAYGFFFLCRFHYLTDNAERIIHITQKLIGKRLSTLLIKKTIYEQFVAGNTKFELQRVVSTLHQHGVGLLLALPMEDDAGLTTELATKEQWFDENLENLISGIKLCKELEGSFPMFQLKGTAFLSGDLAKEISDRCGSLEINKDVLEALVLGMKGESVDFSKILGWEDFSSCKNGELLRALQRFREINKAVLSNDVIAMMDAEYTYMNPTLRLFTLAMAKICSQDKPRVFYTYQAYLKCTQHILEEDIAFAREAGYCFGAKLVRGAYMIKERKLAKSLGYEDPVQPTFEATCENYHQCLDILLHRTQQDAGSIKFIIGSHNEDTVHYAMKRIEHLGIDRQCSSVFFGQIYGMADHISYTLGNKGYQVFKSIPYGSVQDTVPYLSRRAQENKSILDNARREKELVSRALKDRLLFKR